MSISHYLKKKHNLKNLKKQNFKFLGKKNLGFPLETVHRIDFFYPSIKIQIHIHPICQPYGRVDRVISICC